MFAENQNEIGQEMPCQQQGSNGQQQIAKNFIYEKKLIFNLEKFIFCIPIDPMNFYILYSLYSKKVAMIQQQVAIKKVENIDYK